MSVSVCRAALTCLASGSCGNIGVMSRVSVEVNVSGRVCREALVRDKIRLGLGLGLTERL